jgi:uncharacterized membrane protein YoaK (UPF0700 family)
VSTSSGVATRSPKTSSIWSASFPFGLSLVAGLVDTTTFLTLAGLFSAHITGNLVVLAADLASSRPTGLAAVLAIPTFIIVTAIATTLHERAKPNNANAVGWFLGVQCVLLIAATTLGILTHASTDPPSLAGVATGLLAVAAMATQHSLVHLARSPAPSTAVMTGNLVLATIALTQIVLRRQSPDAATHERWRSHWPLIAGFFAGCLIAGLACRWRIDAAWIASVIVSLVLVLVWVIGSHRATQPPALRQSVAH